MSGPALTEGGALLQLLLSCPKCGGPFTADDETRSVSCDHCGSLLVLEAPDRVELYVVDGQLRASEDLLEVFVGYRVQAQRAQIIERYRDSDDNPPSELFIENRLRAFEAKLRETARVLDARQIQVPYWHLTGSIVQGILGREGRDIKAVRVRSFAVEHTLPGYDTQRANLRDRGLRLNPSLARPLTTALVAERPRFLGRLEIANERYREIDKWLARNLDRGIEPISKHGAFLFRRRLLVYRPYWLARISGDRGVERVLFDGSFGTIAGYPEDAELTGLAALQDRDPLGAGGEAYRRVTISAPRCPDCGFEHAVERSAALMVCTNCHLGLRPATGGLALVGYDHAAFGESDLDASYLPFWTFALRVGLADGTLFESVDAWARSLFPVPPPRFSVTSKRLWVPAFRLLGSPLGDRTFKSLVEWIHATPPEERPGKVPVGGRARFTAVSVTSDEARELAPFALLGLHSKPSAARLNHLALQRSLVQARVEASDPRLIMVPFQSSANGPQAPGAGVQVPALLLSGGPALAAQRATVYAAMARR